MAHKIYRETLVLQLVQKLLDESPSSTAYDVSVRRTLYLSLVKSNLCYACEVWSPYICSQKTKIERVQRRATRWILKARKGDSSYNERLVDLNLLPLCYDREIKDLMFFYKALYERGRPTQDESRLKGKHFQTTSEKRKRCVVCGYQKSNGKYKDTKTYTYCAKCKKHICKNCFEDYHTRLVIKK
ncbi:Hypothetical predicted protein [Paramuricea clavata]|uniref:Uncharacterized protein n=1 Tax=Paramuricea clavata TaxID=317549 RepID=A0A7D9DAP3_PARCT|nr:Hypothetical predicted protein [Paramuricea clavata]